MPDACYTSDRGPGGFEGFDMERIGELLDFRPWDLSGIHDPAKITFGKMIHIPGFPLECLQSFRLI